MYHVWTTVDGIRVKYRNFFSVNSALYDYKLEWCIYKYIDTVDSIAQLVSSLLPSDIDLLFLLNVFVYIAQYDGNLRMHKQVLC